MLAFVFETVSVLFFIQRKLFGKTPVNSAVNSTESPLQIGALLLQAIFVAGVGMLGAEIVAVYLNVHACDLKDNLYDPAAKLLIIKGEFGVERITLFDFPKVSIPLIHAIFPVASPFRVIEPLDVIQDVEGLAVIFNGFVFTTACITLE